MRDLCERRTVGSVPQLPAVALDVNLDPSTLPGPFLRRNFRFSGAAPGVVPETEHLPRLVGVAHDDEGLSVAKRIIEGLPRGSRVGLEFDELQLLGVAAGELMMGISMSFTSLSQYAESAGHTPILIERPSMIHPKENQRLLRQMSTVVNEMLLAEGGPERQAVLLKKLWRLRDMMHPNRGCEVGAAVRTSAWRSELMARHIALRGGWRASDVVIVGTAHALNIARIFNTRVSIAIGRYRDQAHFEGVMRDELLEQAIDHHSLNRSRQWHRSLHSLGQPLRNLTCPTSLSFLGGKSGRIPHPSDLS